MANIKLKYVQRFVDRHGKPRHYFRQDSQRVRLPGVPGSQEFMDAYAAALAQQPPPVSPRAQAAPGTFNALAIEYYGSPEFGGLSLATKRNYRRIIDRFREEHGKRRVDQMRPSHVRAIIGKMADRPGAGTTLLKRLRTLINYAIAEEWISADPTRRIKTYASKEFHTWTEAEIAQFEARWPVGSKQRLGFALHLYTGQRGSDVHRMTWPDISGDAIQVRQNKTGAELVIVLHPRLQEVLAAAPRKHISILTTEYGRPFSVKGFGQFMSGAIRKAGLPARCKAHGLRKAAARRLAEIGCSTHEIMSLTGHKTISEVERYTRAVEQARLNRQAIGKQVANDRVSNPVSNPTQEAQK